MGIHDHGATTKKQQAMEEKDRIPVLAAIYDNYQTRNLHFVISASLRFISHPISDHPILSRSRKISQPASQQNQSKPTMKSTTMYEL
jgi:hypothetical protein